MAQRFAIDKNLEGKDASGEVEIWEIRLLLLKRAATPKTHALKALTPNLRNFGRYGGRNKRDGPDFEGASDDDEKITHVFVLRHSLVK